MSDWKQPAAIHRAHDAQAFSAEMRTIRCNGFTAGSAAEYYDAEAGVSAANDARENSQPNERPSR